MTRQGTSLGSQRCSEELSPTAKPNGGQYQQGGTKVLTRTWSAVLRLSNKQRNKLGKMMRGYRCAYNLAIELFRAAGYGEGKEGLVAPLIDPAMKRVIEDCVTKEGTNRGQKRKAGDEQMMRRRKPRWRTTWRRSRSSTAGA